MHGLSMDWAYGYATGKLLAWSPGISIDVAEDIVSNICLRRQSEPLDSERRFSILRVQILSGERVLNTRGK